MTVPVPSRLVTGITLVRLASSYAAFTVLKRVVPLRALARRAWTVSHRRDPRRGARAIAGVVRIGRLAGASRGDCLQLALLMYRELSRAGEHPVLVVGLRQDAGRTLGHAWVEVDEAPIAESAEDLKRFTRTICFGEGGRPLRERADEGA